MLVKVCVKRLGNVAVAIGQVALFWAQQIGLAVQDHQVLGALIAQLNELLGGYQRLKGHAWVLGVVVGWDVTLGLG